jgi:ribosomal protein S7
MRSIFSVRARVARTASEVEVSSANSTGSIVAGPVVRAPTRQVTFQHRWLSSSAALKRAR